MHATLPLLNALGFPAIRRGRLEALQVNLTYRCNQRCLHCHVNAGPTRSEAITDESLALLHQVIDAHPGPGAPRKCTRVFGRSSLTRDARGCGSSIVAT